MYDVEKDWNERSSHASSPIDGYQKSPLDEPEMKLSPFIFSHQ